MNPISPSARARAASAVLALACAIPMLFAEGLFAEGASATPTGACRDQLCAGAVKVGTMPVTWSSPEVFYPNNEDVYAGVFVGPRPLAEVRRYGPALCRHRFAGARISVVVKACLSETSLLVRATSARKNLKLVRISYAARPGIAGDADQPGLAETIYDGLTQITGLAADTSSGL